MKTPQLDEKRILEILQANGVSRDKVSVLAIRGYYLDSMGAKGKNDRMIYDDAMFVVWPDGISRWQANTDPNGYRKGKGTGANKGMAMLKPGVWCYGIGKHKGKLAFRQCEKFTVIRDGSPSYEDTGWHAINLHSGGTTSTSSLGCQTIPAKTWGEFRSQLYSLLERYRNPIRSNDWGEKVRSFKYVLVEETDLRKNILKAPSN